MEFETYQEAIRQDAQNCLQVMGLQPILFIGSGLSQRYFKGPSWEGLLAQMASQCPLIEKDFAYYKQRHHSYFPDIGTVFAEVYAEWAWGEGRDKFADNLFDASHNSSIYFKSAIADYFEGILPLSTLGLSDKHLEEIEALKLIRPYTIITTNYDRFIELCFPDYTPVIGQQIIKADFTSTGEILKIHGCSSSPESIVITKDDYDDFMRKKKYLSAKLLTFFTEHPIIFMGYSANDQNINTILSDIDEILSSQNELILNVYVIEWERNVESLNSFPTEKLIQIENHKSVRIKSILANDFSWVLQAFECDNIIDSVNPKILRALLSHTYKLVRCDIPKRTVEVDYETLERVVSSDSEFAKLFGITTLDDPSAVNAIYPYTLTQLCQALGYKKGWYNADLLIKEIKTVKGINIRESDNRYHLAIKSGAKTIIHKYSHATLELLTLVRDGKDYKINCSL